MSATRTTLVGEAELKRTDIEIRKIGDEWCAFHTSGKELGRSKEKELLNDWLKDALR